MLQDNHLSPLAGDLATCEEALSTCAGVSPEPGPGLGEGGVRYGAVVLDAGRK